MASLLHSKTTGPRIMLKLPATMAEVTRLTRAGRLKEAVAVLQGAKAGLSNAETKPHGPGTESTHAANMMRDTMRDVAPPLSGVAQWTAAFGTHDESTRASSGLRVPEAMRGLVDRLGKLDLGHALRDISGDAPVSRAPLPPGARFEGRTFDNRAGSRGYKLYIPSCYTGEPLPLVVMLHGCTQSPDDFAAGTRMNELAQEQGFLVAYPAQSSSANPSKCWNWFSPNDQRRGDGEPSLIAGITQQIMADFAVDPVRVYVAGLSAGGAAAAIMGATYPDLYAAIGVHSGLACGAARDMPSAFTAMRQGATGSVGSGMQPIPTIVFHGDRDKTVNPVNGDRVIAQAKATATFDVTVSRGQSAGGIDYTRRVQADETGRAVLEQWVLHGTDHAWSGGSPAGSFTDPRGPNASREMVRFFLAHPRRSSDSANRIDSAHASENHAISE
jgi:poly(hydroxyalkanoate) depolymerase family esterase